MSTRKLLDSIRNEIFNHLLTNADKHPLADTGSKEKMVELFDVILTSIEVGNPKLIEPLLEGYIENQNSESTTYESWLLDDLTNSIIWVSQEQFSLGQSQLVINGVLPVYFQANNFFHNRELQKKIDQINQEQSSLEQLEKSKSDFISIAAHELKTPLTLMEGYSAMLRDLLEQKKIYDEHILLLVDGMDSGSRRLREIISDMIDVSLIDNELLALSFQPTWMFKLLLRVKEHFEEPVQSRRMTLEVLRFSGDDIAIFCDGERVFQAISNVVSNAIKYTPDGGRIKIEGRQLHDFIEIAIIDNGIGIDPHDQIKIFDKFQAVGEVSLHSSGKLKFKGGGPGLGLPISKGIIEAHGGRIWVESEGYDEAACPGSEFHILLPIREGPPEIKSTDLYEPLFVRKPQSRST